MTIEDLVAYFENVRPRDRDIRRVVEDELPSDFHYAHGETRWAIWCDNWDIVVKIPRYGYVSDDYCQLEIDNYLAAVKWGVERVCLPIEVYCTNLHGLTIYTQKKYTISTGDGNDKGYRHYLSKRDTDVVANKNIVDVVRANCYHSRLDRYWTARMIQLYGKKFARSFEKWTQECRINDLHNGNTGWLNNKPILLDYAGYHD